MVSVTPSTASLIVAQTKQLSASATNSDGSTATPTATWSSSNSAVATVSSSGLVTAVAAGSATITASVATSSGSSSTVTGTANITVTTASTPPATPTAVNGTVQGTVKDFTTSSGIPGVTLAFVSSANTPVGTATSDASGQYSLTMPPGATHGNVSVNGYVLTGIDFVVVNGVTSTVDLVVLVPAGTSPNGGVSGTIRNATNNAALNGVYLEVRNGVGNKTGTVVANATADPLGAYSFASLPAGTYTVTASLAGYVPNSFTVGVVGGVATANQDATLSPSLATGEVRIVLTWGARPSDLDSHLTGPQSGSSTRFHVYYASRGSSTLAPYAKLDLDDVSSYGPETTTITQRISGLYRYTVRNFSGGTVGNELSNSGAQVKVYVGSAAVQTFNIPANTAGRNWVVFELDGGTGAVTPINTFDNNTTFP